MSTRLSKLGINGDLEESAKILDQYYTTTRYPDSVIGGAPFETFTEKQAREAIVHAGKYAFAHRRDKKADRRRGWQVVINGAVRDQGLTYSRFISGLKSKKIALNRKMLADLAANHPKIFQNIIASVK